MLKVVLFVLLFHSGICLQDVENTATETVQSETLAENPIVAEVKSEETALPVDNADSSSITGSPQPTPKKGLYLSKEQIDKLADKILLAHGVEPNTDTPQEYKNVQRLRKVVSKVETDLNKKLKETAEQAMKEQGDLQDTQNDNPNGEDLFVADEVKQEDSATTDGENEQDKEQDIHFPGITTADSDEEKLEEVTERDNIGSSNVQEQEDETRENEKENDVTATETNNDPTFAAITQTDGDEEKHKEEEETDNIPSRNGQEHEEEETDDVTSVYQTADEDLGQELEENKKLAEGDTDPLLETTDGGSLKTPSTVSLGEEIEDINKEKTNPSSRLDEENNITNDSGENYVDTKHDKSEIEEIQTAERKEEIEKDEELLEKDNVTEDKDDNELKFEEPVADVEDIEVVPTITVNEAVVDENETSQGPPINQVEEDEEDDAGDDEDDSTNLETCDADDTDCHQGKRKNVYSSENNIDHNEKLKAEIEKGYFEKLLSFIF